MLIRDLEWLPYDNAHWERATIRGPHGTVKVFRPTPLNTVYKLGHYRFGKNGIVPDVEDRRVDDEFTAQCLLDFYLQNKSPLKLSDDP